MSAQPARFKKINSQKKVLVIGSAVIDVVVTIPSIPRSGGDVFASNEEVIVGGCAYNVGNILQQLNANYDLMVPIGSGTQADTIKKQMKIDGHREMLKDLVGDNGWCLCMVENDGERTFLTVPGIEHEWKDDWFDQVNVDEYDYIYLSGYSFEGPSAEVILKQLRKKREDTIIIFDPSPRVSEMNREHLDALLTMGTIIHGNRDELTTITDENDVETAARQLNKWTKQPVIITLGAEGTLVAEDGVVNVCSGHQVDLVDTIGAGDTHTGAFITALLDDQTMQVACEWGNDAAAKVVQIQGGKVDLFEN